MFRAFALRDGISQRMQNGQRSLFSWAEIVKPVVNLRRQVPIIGSGMLAQPMKVDLQPCLVVILPTIAGSINQHILGISGLQRQAIQTRGIGGWYIPIIAWDAPMVILKTMVIVSVA